MKPIHSFLFLLCTAFAIGAIACKTPQDSGVVTRMNWADQTVNIQAQQQPLSAVLSQLEVQEGIRVQVEDFEEKEVSTSIRNQSLDSALVQLLGPDKRYFIDFGKREFPLPGGTTEKKGRRVPFKPGLKPKYAVKDTALIRDDDLPQRNIKPKAGDFPLVESTGEPGTKLPARALDTLQVAAVVKEDKPAITLQDGRYIRLRFRMDGERITVEKAYILPGELTVPPVTISDYVYTIQMGGDTLATGSFQDPLEMHSHFPEPEREHATLQAPVGYFSISIPDRIVRTDQLRALTVEIYRVVGPVPLSTFGIRQLPQLRDQLRLVSTNVLEREDFPVEDLTQ